MICRQCGTEIADKAIVCYRCGRATTDPIRKPVRIRRRRSMLPSAILAVLLVLAALYMGHAAETVPEPAPWRTTAAVLVAAAIVVLLVRIVRRRGAR